MPIIQSDTRGKFVPFIADNSDESNPPVLTSPYYGAVELGLEKQILSNPLKADSSLKLYAKGVSRYTGSGEAVETTNPVILELLAALKTLHAVTITPSVVTLDEDNNYTTFCAVEANDGANWTLAPVDSRITVTPASGTGRTPVVVKKAASFNPTGNFTNIPLTAVSTTSLTGIDGFQQVSDTAEVHVEKYAPQHNALIPKMLSEQQDGVTVSYCQRDTANELNAAYAVNALHAAFAITSENDVLHIDAGAAVVLDRIELTGTNVNRTLAPSVVKGGAAAAFSLLAANDPNGTWTTLRSGSTVTDFAAVTYGNSVGQWSYNEDYDDSQCTATLAHSITTPFRYYRIVPVNRSQGRELSCTLHRLNLYKKVAAAPVSMTDATVMDSRNTAATTLRNIAISSAYLSINDPQYRFTVDLGTAKKVDLVQITTSSSNSNDRLVQAPDGLIISGSSNGTTWTPLMVSDQPVAIGGTFAHSFEFTTGTAYRYYQIEIANPYSLSFTLSQVRFFEKGSGSVSCLLPKSPYLTCPQEWESPVMLTSAVRQAEAWKVFDHSLTVGGFAGRFSVGLFFAGTSLASGTGAINPFALDNLDQFPSIEVSFDTPHRIRSWSLQSVGDRIYENTGAVFESLATAFILQGRTLDGKWKVLDLARTRTEYDNEGNSMPELYTAKKIRLDRSVQQTELVDKLRISVVAVYYNSAYSRGLVWLPQIQIFAGVPVIPKMTQSSQDNVRVQSNGGEEYIYDDYYSTQRDAGVRVFDREVSGTGIAKIGSRGWYSNNGDYLQEGVAENGSVGQFGTIPDSKAWLVLMFPPTRILGYLYSIDHLKNRTDTAANVSYAASLYFEGRAIADNDVTRATSEYWDFINIVSLDHCLGHNMFGVSTSALIAESSQATLNAYVTALGLPVFDRAFLMNQRDYHIIRYDGNARKWYDDGLRLAPGTTESLSNQFNGMTTDGLLGESGQSRLNSVARLRGGSMTPGWTEIPDKASIVNQKDAKRMMYDLVTETWSEVPNNDAIYHVDDQTHYADLKDGNGDPMLLAQLRCTAQSIMNTEKPSVGGEPVAMPEMQLFGLPAGTINGTTVATIAYLKAEDSAGNLYDVLGKHQRLPHHSYYSSTTFRIYLGAVQNIKSVDKRVYLDIHNTSGTVAPSSVPVEDNYNPYRTFSVSGDCRTMCYFELYINSANDEKIVLASGYTGGVS